MRPKKVLLVVDDNEQQLSVTKFILETKGYRVLPATNGQEAIAIFSATYQVDLVLADATMPQMSGAQLVERLKRMKPYVPMMLLTDGTAATGEFHEADAMIARKSCSTQELLERIKLMSARKRGPRKGSQRKPVGNYAEIAAEVVRVA
jgi:CheY-like chemotaxis protein